MRWFKHVTTAMDDLFIQDLEAKFGDTGYVFWFKTLELLGAQGEKGKMDISEMVWRQIIHSHRTDHLRRLYAFATARGKLTVEELPNGLLRVDCPKFAEYADNYTRYDGVSTKRLQRHYKASTKQEEEVDIEVEKKKNKEPKKQVAEFVTLTDTEYSKLVEELGEGRARACITILDDYKGSKGKKYASDYRAIRSWVIGELQKREGTVKVGRGVRGQVITNDDIEQQVKRLTGSAYRPPEARVIARIVGEVEIAKACNPPFTPQQRDALVRLLNGTGWTLEEITDRAKAVIARHTFGSIAFEHWKTEEEESVQEVKARFQCSYCDTEWWGLPGSRCPVCFDPTYKSASLLTSLAQTKGV